ncbi:MAG TPA: penicillin-binding protein 1A [Steroidobacteraceae bacterium]|nr:penicillin-binding protein 1A [Steroidobacteraceae bacterium]
MIMASVMLVTLLIAYAFACSYIYLAPSLPTPQAMRGVEFQVPLRVYTRSGGLIAQIGEQRRIPVTYEQIPELVKHAFLAAEDDRFFQHHGIDYLGVVRAIVVDFVSGDKTQGASTITMQAARNMFLTLDKTYRRKLQETFVTYEMEHEFSKQEIFGLYLNVIFFGQRAYGVAAAAETFFGKSLDQLTVAEAATIAGVPKAPSRYNPIVNPQLAMGRRSYVLRRMKELGFIDAATAEAANREPVDARAHAPLYDVEAPYIAEMARLEVRQRFGVAAESAGYRVFTTVDGRLQSAANRAVRIGLIEYDRRHGWRGPAGHADINPNGKPEALDEVVDEYSSVGNLLPAVVVSVAEKAVRVYVRARGLAQIDWDGLSWARRATNTDTPGPAPRTASDIVARGDVVYVVANGRGVAQLAQVPEAQSALVALDPHDGGIAALVGGFDYFSNKYNRVIQARRLPGSGFKPFLYSCALENGFTPASVLLDAPFVLEGAGLESSWRPENSTRQFRGPTRLREALVHSRNLVSIRLLREMGIGTAIDYAGRFGFEKQQLPDNLTLALGTLQATPLQIATGYAVFANGGFRVLPYFIDRIENAAGQIVYQAAPRVACDECEHPVDLGDLVLTGTDDDKLHAADTLRGGRGALPQEQVAERVISPQNAYLMTDMMADVIKRGTGRRALALGRGDIAGKTGTTNEAKDTWFNGFTQDLVATVWVGFDQERPLGEAEEGAKTALPIWIHFMREALKGVPDEKRPMPDGLVTLRVSSQTGALVSAENPDGVMETFMADHLPGAAEEGSAAQSAEGTSGAEPIF